MPARYVRIQGKGNSSSNDWNSYTEVNIRYLSATGIIDDRSGTRLRIYPQPANEGMYVLLPGWKQETDMQMVDMLGRVSMARLTGESTWISTGRLASGLYLIRVPEKKVGSRIIGGSINIILYFFLLY